MICDKLQLCAERQFAGEKMLGCANRNMKACVESSDMRSYVKCEEKKKKYVLENTQRNHIISYRMDGGVIVLDQTVPDGICKCDYLFLIDGVDSSAILIELKGVDVMHALKQIHGVVKIYKGLLHTFSHVYGRIIVTSSMPNLRATPDYVNLVRLIKKSFGRNIKICERKFEEMDVELSKE